MDVAERRQVSYGVVATTVAAATLVVLAVLAVKSGIGGDKPPYTDPSATGLLTLCTADGKAVTGGKVDQQLAGVVLGASAAPQGYDGPGAVGTVYAHQPREGVDPAEFSGIPLTAAARFTDAQHPAARVTEESTTVADFVAAFPAQFEGYVQLRLVVSAPDAGAATHTYDSADLKVDGDTWTLVRGGSADCSEAVKTALAPTGS